MLKKKLLHIWHPATPMKDFESYPPVAVNRAQGCYLHTENGLVLDAISSWWCKSLGHGHPRVIAAIKKQLTQFEHVIGAGIGQEQLELLGEKLHQITGLQRSFYACDGSSAVEIALKIALHAKQIQGEAERNQFIALKNAYHGETFGTLSVSDLGLFKEPYSGLSLDCHFIDPLPYVSNRHSPSWDNAEQAWRTVLPQLEAVKNKCCALIVEPLLQGAGGMLCYSADFLKRLATWSKENHIYFIADEIMTGMGRTGNWLACQHAKVKPDLICLSKGLTSGTIPFSCVLADESIFQLFYADYEANRTFWHSHTYSGNALGASAALATLLAMEEENINQSVNSFADELYQNMEEIAKITGKLTNIRHLGAVVAADLEPLQNQKRTGFKLSQVALKNGVLLRPLGNTLYWLPPLIIQKAEIEKLAQLTLNSIRGLYE